MSKSPALSLYAAGLNAHGQLNETHTNDLLSFEAVPGTRTTDLQVLFAGWSSTTIRLDSQLIGLGHHELHYASECEEGRLSHGVGDHNGMLCCLDANGRMYIVDSNDRSHELRCVTSDDSPRVEKLALAGNGRAALTFKQAPDGRLCHIAEFESFEAFLCWYSDPSADDNYPDNHHMISGRPKELIANTATFMLLMEDGTVFTWGDSRYQSLGRSLSAIEDATADKPATVDALSGVRIVKIATGGWIGAALSDDGALYLWGEAHGSGSDDSIRALTVGEVSLVELPVEQDQEPVDIMDVAVGNNHVAVVAANGRLFVVGDNRNGQLGLGETGFQQGWREVAQLVNVHKVFCGPEATFAIVQEA